MRRTVLIRREEYEIAGHHLRRGDGIADIILCVRRAREIDARIGKYVAHKAGAVKSCGRRAAKGVRNSNVLHGVRDHAANDVVRTTADLRHGFSKKRLIRGRPYHSVDSKSLCRLEFLHCLCRCRTKVAVCNNVITKAGQLSLNLGYVSSLIAELE